MNFSLILYRLVQVLAIIGGAATVVSALNYFRSLVEWGLYWNWHFTNVVGWGFRFLSHFADSVLALFLVVPFWISAKKLAPARYAENRKVVNLLVLIGLLMFVLAMTLESSLDTVLP